MPQLQPRLLREQAQSLLQTIPYNPKKLVLIHTGISLGASLVVMVLSYILHLGMAQTGGLEGIGMRSALASVQAILEFAIMVLSPFWNMGLLYAALNWSKGENATPACLLQGFYRFLPLLGLGCLLGGLCFVLFIAIAIPVFYRLRFAHYSIMEGSSTFQSILHSVRITRGNVLRLIRLDLSFWWFYLLQCLTVALCYGDALLPYLGISLPVSSETAYFLFFCLGILAQGVLLWQYQATVSTAYCLAYRELTAQSEETI